MDETVVKSLYTPNCQQDAINLLSKLAVNLPGMIFQVLQQQDGSVLVLYVSSGCEYLYELEPEAIQKDFRVLYKLIHPQDIKAFTESIDYCTTNITHWHWEGRIITPSGKLKWIQATSQPELQESGDLLWNGLVMDITDRKQAQEKLLESEARYQAILDAIPDLMFRISRDSEYLDLKSEGANVILSREEIVGKHVQELLPSDVAAISLEAITKTLDSGTLQTCEYQLPTPLGVKDYEARLVVSGEDEVVAIVRDITERKQAEVALQNLAQKFAKAFSCSPDSITISTLQEGRFIEVNDSFVKLSGYERDEAIGKTSFELNLWVHDRDRQNLLQELQATGVVRNLEFEFRQKSGKIITTLLSAEIIDLDGLPSILAVHHDITERKQVEAQLRLSAERDRLLAETLVRIRSSLKLEEILQTTVTEVRQFLQADRVFIGLNNTKLGAKTLAESVVPKYPSVTGWSTNDEAYLQELRNLLKDNVVGVIEDITQVALSPKVKAHFQKFQTKATLSVPIMLGNELFGALIANQCSGPRHWQPIEIDLLQQMSEQVAIAIQQSQIYQKLAELNTNLEHQVQERTAQLQQKMQEVEELHRVKDVVLHTVAHDLRTSVMGNLMVLKNLLNQKVGSGELGVGSWEVEEQGAGGKGENFPLPPACRLSASYAPSPMPNPQSPIPVSRRVIERMIQGNDRQLTMINSLLEINSYEKQGIDIKPEPLDFNTLLEVTFTQLEPILTQNQATLKNLVPADLPLVMADATRLQKVLAHLITHSLQNNPPGLNFILSASVEDKMIRTQIQDDGVIMRKLECDRLFDLHVRDPQDCCSTSIGLKTYLCRKVIKAHGGEIGVTSNRKRGLTFWFTLPLATSATNHP
ncbi:multi-sensor signal transduction histidine kinase [Nostoc commune NIES-4072]|uniref:histidine kinase n=1 Tax=Nostoc commune NIES-4072 TaxID=2005467 RepID=A0A2R5FIW8_NOSCO|nr:PAS domain S-box protein [Nostoc commune]BBD63988.1 multi-sensor signal transduction histidine kinase [Nostoc commune HK-02]GBG18686.1 multi-sensor signal transduction histidine kinase [Nostoc commune NIES-4072]